MDSAFFLSEFCFFLRLDLDQSLTHSLEAQAAPGFSCELPCMEDTSCTGALPLAGPDVDVPSLEIEVSSNPKMADKVLHHWQGYPNGTRAPS